MASHLTSNGSCYALVTYHNGFPLYGILRKSKIRCINEHVIRYNGCSYDASILTTGSKQYCELCLSIIENQPSVLMEKTMKFNVKSRSEKKIQVEDVPMSGSQHNEVESPAISTQCINTEIKISGAVLMNLFNEKNVDVTRNHQNNDTFVLDDITNQSDIIKHKSNNIDPNEVTKDKCKLYTVPTGEDFLQSEEEDSEMGLLDYSTSDDEFDSYINIYENKDGSHIFETSEELRKSIGSDIYLNDGNHHATTPEYGERSIKDNSISTTELEEIHDSDVNLHELHISNNDTTTTLCLHNLSDNPATTPECLEMSDKDNSLLTSELEDIHDFDGNLHELQISNNGTPTPPSLQNLSDNLATTPEYLGISECALSNVTHSSPLHSVAATEVEDNVSSDHLYTKALQEMESTSNESYVATTLMNIPTPAEIRNEAMKHASFEGCPCSRSSSAVKKILSPEDKTKHWRFKYHFCIYCKKRVTRFARHLTTVHKNEPEVIRINLLPAKNSTRLNLLDNIRNRGMLMYNLDDRYNAGDTIVVRRPAKENKSNFYIPCSNCGGNFRKRNLSRHYKKCTNSTETKRATLTSRLLGKPILKEYFENVSTLMAKGKIDTLSQVCVQDTAILLYGSKLVSDHASEIHRDNDIRSKLRQMAQLLIEIKKLDTSVKELMDAFVPSKIKIVELAIKKICCYDPIMREYKKPSMAVHVTTLIRKCVDSSVTFMIESNLPERKIQMESFLHLLRDNLVGIARSGVNKLQQNKMTSAKRVPLASDIHKLNMYLKEQAADAYKILQNGFNEEAWNTLSECSLLLLMIFNRKRTGESERILLANYYSKKPINEDSDIYKTLDKDLQKICKQFSRMEILGKWRRIVVMLFPPLFITYIDTILKYRDQAGVSNDNKYLFGTKSGKNSHRFANAALSYAAIKCGAANPASLRGTNLRKHIATVTQMVNMSDSDIKLLSSFMGHDQFIHETSYRQTDSTLQIAKLTKLLMAFNEGSLEKIKGKTLDEIEMDPDLLADTTQDKQNFTKKTAAKRSMKTVPSLTDSEIESDISDTYIPDSEIRKQNSKKVTFKRRRWTENEIKELDKYFGAFYISHNLPSLNSIDVILNKCTYLKGRTSKQINAQICNKKRIHK